MGQVTLTTAEYNAMLLENIRLKATMDSLITIGTSWGDSDPTAKVDLIPLKPIIESKFAESALSKTHRLRDICHWFDLSTESIFEPIPMEDSSEE